MKRFFLRRFFLITVAFFAAIGASWSQTSAMDEDERSWVLSFIESQISTPSRQIRFHNIEGSLSSQAHIGEITIADMQGVWLRLNQVKIDWNRSALLLGSVSINELRAEHIEFLRKPLPDPDRLTNIEARFFSIPQLPVAVEIGSVSAPLLILGEDLFGRAARLSLEGAIELDDGSVTSHFSMRDLEGSAHLDLVAHYDKPTNNITLDFGLEEPKNGIIANLLELEGHPSIVMSLKGAGEVSTLEVDLALDVDGKTLLDGVLALQPSEEGQIFRLEAGGGLRDLLPRSYQTILGEETRLDIKGLLPLSGGWQLDDIRLTSGAALQLQARASMGRDGFLHHLHVEANAQGQGEGSLLQQGQLTIAYGMPGDEEWHGHLAVEGVNFANLEPFNMTLDMGGRAENLDDAARRRVSFLLYGGASRVNWPKSDNIDEVTLLVDMALEPQSPLMLNGFDIGARGGLLNIVGQFENWQFDGAARFITDDMASFLSIVGQDIGGKAEVTLSGQVALLSGAFEMEITGKADRVYVNQPLADRLLGTEFSLNGKIKRDGQGLHFDRLAMKGGDLIALKAQGLFSWTYSDLDIALDMPDLFWLDERLRGALQLKAAMRGHNGFMTLSAHGETVDDITLSGRRLEETIFDFNGFFDTTQPYYPHFGGQFQLGGRFDGQQLALSGDVSLGHEERRFDNLAFILGAAQIAGQFDMRQDGMVEGGLQLDIADLSSVAALFLLDGQGSMQGAINFTNEAGEQGIHGQFEAHHLRLGSYQLERLEMKSRLQGHSSHLEIMAHLPAMYGRLEAVAMLTPRARLQWDLVVERAHLQGGILDIALGAPAHLSLSENGTIKLGEAQLHLKDGRVVLSGQIDENLTIDMRLEQIPLALANLFQPQLQAQGEVNGMVYMRGTRIAPRMDFTLSATDISTAFLQQNNLYPLALQARGLSDGEILEFNFDIRSGSDIEATGKGDIHLRSQAMNVDIALKQAQLTYFATLFRAQGLSGQLAGSGHIGGTLTRPQAQFDMEAVQISSLLLSENGLSPLNAGLRGRFEEQNLTLESFQADGPAGLHFRASGQVPLSGQGINLRTEGGIPLALANRFLGSRGGQLSGLLTIEATVGGSIQNPLLGGHFTIDDGQFIDPPSNVHFKDITIEGQMAGDNIVLENIRSVSVGGGRLTGTGTISTNFEQGLPANIRLQLEQLRYYDGAMLAATMQGAINLVGPLMRDFELGGVINVERMEVSIPNVASNIQEIVVQHKNLNKKIATTLARAQIDVSKQERIPTLQKKSLAPRLNLEIRAPARIFVRGRGLDSELGGAIFLEGRLDEPIPSGSFNLIRGRFDILTKRLELDEGVITLSGTLDPLLDFTARTQGNGIDVTVRAHGNLSDLSLDFSAQPSLPQDEVLAVLIFNRSFGELSPLQIAQMAASVAELSGQDGISLMGRLRAATGLDDLDVVSDDQGRAGVRAGRYLRDNIYLGVEADNQGQTRGNINLDIGKDLKAKGSVDSQSNSSIGLFFERDY